MQADLFSHASDDPVAVYIHLTGTVLPAMARRADVRWPVREDHCFQRIVLDHVCGGVWYDTLKRPAYKHLSRAQAEQAASLAQDIADGRADLTAMNRQSLIWRGKYPKR
ncbi:MAG: hypothetical protein AAF601_12755 [Pseudomonadota bacterium]